MSRTLFISDLHLDTARPDITAALATFLQDNTDCHTLYVLGDLAEYRVAPALHVLAGMVEEVVVLDVDEKLRRGRVGVHGAGHGNGTEIILQAIIRLILDRLTSGLLLEIRVETATLDHEIVDNPVENCAVIESVAGILVKVLHRLWGFLGVQFQFDLPDGGANDNPVIVPVGVIRSRAMRRAFAWQENSTRTKMGTIAQFCAPGGSICYKPEG